MLFFIVSAFCWHILIVIPRFDVACDNKARVINILIRLYADIVKRRTVFAGFEAMMFYVTVSGVDYAGT